MYSSRYWMFIEMFKEVTMPELGLQMDKGILNLWY